MKSTDVKYLMFADDICVFGPSSSLQYLNICCDHAAEHKILFNCKKTIGAVLGVRRLDGARGKKQVWRPMFEPEIFRNQMYCMEESTCDNVGTFRRPRSDSAAP